MPRKPHPGQPSLFDAPVAQEAPPKRSRRKKPSQAQEAAQREVERPGGIADTEAEGAGPYTEER